MQPQEIFYNNNSIICDKRYDESSKMQNELMRLASKSR